MEICPQCKKNILKVVNRQDTGYWYICSQPCNFEHKIEENTVLIESSNKNERKINVNLIELAGIFPKKWMPNKKCKCGSKKCEYYLICENFTVVALVCTNCLAEYEF